MKDLPLVSIGVLTYNSSKYVIETLESIKMQTYANIELIVSDDCSTDNTVEICQKWIEENKDRFVRTELLTIDHNTGVSANCNRLEATYSGEWIKGIAGDDIMLPDAILHYINFVNINPKYYFIFARIEAFGENEEINNLYNTKNIFDFTFFNLDKKGQYEKLVLEDAHIPAPTFFYNRAELNKLQIKYDERIPLVEDEPKWINLLKKGAYLNFLDEVTIKYRVGHSESLSANGGKSQVSIKQYESYRRHFFYYKYPDRYINNLEKAVNDVIKEELKIYKDFLEFEKKYEDIRNSYAYKFGKIVVKPVALLKRVLKKIC